MTKPEEIELFDALARMPRFKEWVGGKITQDVQVLSQALDIDQLRRAQGRVGLLQSVLALMEAAPSATKR